jgi:phage terminase large subunit-like protein
LIDVPENTDDRERRAAYYDQHVRDPASKAFYNSAAWKTVRAAVLAEHPVCQRCERTFALHVHHVIPLKECTPAQKTDRANLLCICQPCHNAVEAEAARQVPAVPALSGMLHVTEDDTYLYDPDAAERPVRFIERFATHTEDRFAGPFILLDWQKAIIRTLFGWKRRDNGRRRFRELYLLTAKGSGKTPLLAAIGLYMMFGDGEKGAHVISMASTFEQANYTFGEAKKYVAENKALQKVADPKQFVIRGLGKYQHSKWTLISGKPSGRSGSKPTCVIADECHEWAPETAKSFDLLCANTFKRSNPLVMIATNAAETRSGFAWETHERAMNVLAGKIKDDHLLPVIYAAPPELDWRSEEAAKASNPSIGHFRDFAQDVKPEQAKGEARYRRLFLSQFVTGSDKWIDMATWDACCAVIDPNVLKTLPLYVGLDASGGDDLFAVVYVWVSPERFYVEARFYLPKATADRYEESHRIPFRQWAEDGHITLVDDVTISHAVRQRIAADILETAKTHKVQKLAYDRAWKASEVVAVVEAAGVKVQPVGQGWGVSSGCVELDNRIKEKAITISPNPVLRWNAENAEVEFDKRGNYWPVKPNAKGSYTGRRSAKIDGVSALVTCLTEARTHDFPATAKPYTGGAWVVKLK